jgi:hypothetical protein
MNTLCLGALAAAASMAALAQQPATDPSQADAKVPLPVYRSVFQDTPRGVEEQTADWKKANAEVGQFRRGHVDLLKWEAQRPASAAPAPAPAAPAHKH